MSLPAINPTQTKAWKQLTEHFAEVKDVKMQHLFAQESQRADSFSTTWGDFFVDFSKNRMTSETFSLLLQLADEVELKKAIKAQLSGETINETEKRVVLHTALRDFDEMIPEVSETLQRMKTFSDTIIEGSWKGYSGKPISDIVNIGIGGSDLGPKMVTESLSYYSNHLNVHYISNVDGDHVMETLSKLDRETTIFIIVSKTFTTQETLTNASTIRNWFLEEALEANISKHFVAVSTNLKAVNDFGISSENTFPMWDWVGGRFSLWSAVGLSTCCAIGYHHFEDLLKGAHNMDKHFSETDFSENIPVILGLISIWYANFFAAETEAVIPYTQYLKSLVGYLQQAVMESNGKGVDRNGELVNYQTGTIVWGSTGTNAQHAFFQLLHQGTKLVPCDFIAFATSLFGNTNHQNKLLANCFAQTEALLQGTDDDSVKSNYQMFEGNRPSTTILIQKLTPKSLGSLLALYEHKLFVQGIIWNIYSYDQWGVELGKVVAKTTLASIDNADVNPLAHSDSTQQLIKRARKP